jgi:VanZ family protein
LIFLLSSSAGASSSSSYFVRPVLEWLFPLAADETLAVYHGYIRKSAHVFMYGGLAVLALRAFVGSEVSVLRRHPFPTALVAVLAVAVFDEYHQSLNPSRTGTASDVVLDLAGGSVGSIIVWLYRNMRR